jgi:hypothetical protein
MVINFGKIGNVGRHFRIGELEKKKVIVVMTGESMVSYKFILCYVFT